MKLFDGNARSKWLDTSIQQGRVRMHACGCWCSPTTQDVGILQAWVAIRLHNHAAPRGVRPSHYAVTSANDCVGRDPTAWTLEAQFAGSQDWEELDRQEHQRFARRFDVRQYRIPAAKIGSRTCTAFRLVITAIMETSNVHCTQLSRLQVFCNAADVAKDGGAAATRGGDYGDGDGGGAHSSSGALSSLWLDYARDGPDRDWAVAFRTPPLHRVVATAMGLVGVTEAGVAWLVEPPASLAKLTVRAGRVERRCG